MSKELYAPALGGIMLSIGIKLSIEDFALAFKRSIYLMILFQEYIMLVCSNNVELVQLV